MKRIAPAIRQLSLSVGYLFVRLQWIRLVLRRERLERKIEEVNAEEDFYQEWMEELRCKRCVATEKQERS